MNLLNHLHDITHLHVVLDVSYMACHLVLLLLIIR